MFYPEMEKLLLEFFPNATDALVYNHDVFDKDYKGDRTEDQDNKNPGVNANYAYLVHNDLNDNSGRVRCRELLTKNLRNFGREQHYTEEQADAKMSRRFVSINLAKPMETVASSPSCSAPGPPSPISRISPTTGSTTTVSAKPPVSLTAPPRVVLVSPAKAHRVSMLMLRLGYRRLRFALVFPHRLRIRLRPRRSLPQNLVVRSFIFF